MSLEWKDNISNKINMLTKVQNNKYVAFKYAQGSNQHIQRIANGDKPRLQAGLCLIALFGVFSYLGTIEVERAYHVIARMTLETFNGVAYAPTKLVSPLAYAASPSAKLVPSEHDQIASYIKEVFGKDSDKAFKLLSCENSALNPKALNDNTTWGGVGKDYGVFQINNKWQGVSNEAFLYDWRTNIDMAYSIYSRDGYSFKLWTCGRKLGI